MSVKNLYQKFKGNRALKSVSVFTTINFFSKGISFLLLFIYTQPRFISPEENGLLSLFSSSLLFLMPILSFGILQSASTDIFKMKKQEFSDYFTSAMILPVSVFIISAITFFLLKDFFKVHYQFPYSFSLLIPLVTFLVYINDLFVGLLRDKSELRKYAAAGITKVVLEFGLSVVLVVFFAMRWEGRITGIIVSYVLLGLYAFWYFYKNGYLSGKIQAKYIKEELIFAVPVIAMSVAIFALNTADKFILAKLSKSNEEVGIYGVACSLGSIIIIFSSAYLTYLLPKLYKMLASPDINYAAIKKNFIKYVILMVCVMGLVIVVVPFIYKYLINYRYSKALNYFYLMTIGYFFWSINTFFYAFLLYHKQKRKILFLSLLIIPIAIGSIYYFTNLWGARGAAIGLLLGYFVTLIITILFVKQHLLRIFSRMQKNSPV